MAEQWNLDDLTRRAFGDRSGVSDPIIPQGGYDPQVIARAQARDRNKPPMPAPTPKASEASGGSRIDKSNLADNDPHKSNADIAYVVRTGGGDYPVFYKGSPSAEKWHAEYAANKQAGHDVYNSEVTGLSYKIQNGGSGSSGGQRQMTPAEAGHAAAERSRAESAQRGISPESAEAGHQAAMRTRAAFEKTRAENEANKPTNYLGYFNKGWFGADDNSDQQTYADMERDQNLLKAGLGIGTSASLASWALGKGTNIAAAGKYTKPLAGALNKSTGVIGGALGGVAKRIVPALAGTLAVSAVEKAMMQGMDPTKDIDWSDFGYTLLDAGLAAGTMGILSKELNPSSVGRATGKVVGKLSRLGKSAKTAETAAEEGSAAWKFKNYPEIQVPQGRPMPERMPRGFIGETSAPVQAPAQTPASLAKEVTETQPSYSTTTGAWRKKPEPSYLERDAFGGNKHYPKGNGPHLQHGGAIHKMRGGLRTMKLKKFTK